VRRPLFLLYGGVCYLVFLGTFLYAIGFVEGWGVPRSVDSGGPAASVRTALLVDALLLTLFAVQHSGMARRGFKALWTRVVPPPIERSTYVLAASACLLLLFWAWRPIPTVVWDVQNPALRIAIVVVSAMGWGIVLFGTFLINHFELFGLRQVYLAARRKDLPRPQFRTPLLYRVVRHPIYLGFILAFWFAPTMRLAHLVFAMSTLGYIVVAIQLEERDLVREYGGRYLAYREQVRGLVPIPRNMSGVAAGNGLGDQPD
jgi:protein-S-isoprenylcysteine O-methyltransferase Ste14